MRRAGGFTILEVLVAVAVLAMISVLLWYSFAQTFKAIDIVRADADLFRQARQVTTRVMTDMGEAYIPQFPSPTSNAIYQFKGEDHGGTDRVQFDSFSHTKFYKDANESDQAEVEYYLDPQSKAGPKGIGGLYRLMRREKSVIDNDPDHGGQSYVIAENVRKLVFSYYDPSKDDWKGSWDTNDPSTQNQLPYAVRMKVTMVDSDGQDHTWATATIVRLAKAQDPR